VRDAVVERFSRLDGDTQAVLRATVILAAPVAEATVAEVCGLGGDRVRRGLVAGLACGLLAEDARGLVSFRHALAASAVSDATPALERRALHLSAAEALESQSPQPLTRLARHFRKAGEVARWCRYGEAVADIALATGNEEAAAEVLFDLVTDAGLPTADLPRLVAKFPFGSSDSPLRCRHLASVLESAARAGGLAPSIEGDIRWQLARVLIKCDDFPSACEQIERAIPNLAHDPLNAGRAMIRLCQLSWSDWPAATRLDWLRRGETLAAPDKPADQLELVVDRAMTLVMFGEETGWADAQKIPTHTADPRIRLQAVRGLGAMGHMAMVWGHYAEARRMLSATLDLAEMHRYTRYRYCKVTRVHLDWFTGAWAGLAEQANELACEGDVPRQAQLEAVLVSGLVEAACGNRLSAEDRFRVVLDETRRHLPPEFLMEPAAALAGFLLARGRADEALSVTEEPVAVLSRIGAWVWASEVMPVRVRALVASGQRQQAAHLTRAFAAWLDGRDAPAPMAALVTCQAVVAHAAGDALSAARLFGAAADAWRALPRPHDALLAEEQRARCLLAVGHGTAIGLLTETAGKLTRLGAANDAARIAHLLRERGVEIHQRGWHGGRTSYGNRLSPRETEVVRLLVAGRSSPEIAKALGKSPHTVENQVKSAMRKLGVSSRIMLAVRAVDLGVAPSPGSGSESHLHQD
jgi:DNA-binding CsgD family transcriptional regulator